MNALNFKYLLIGLALCVAAAGGGALKPTKHIADQGPRIDLETMIPKQFGEWKLDETIVPIQVSPDVQVKLNKIYNQTLSRTYVNVQGEKIMLSIVYGSNQRNNDFQVHRPEFCYISQGFQVSSKSDANLDVQGRTIPIRRLLAIQGQRVEPITYWITVGDKATLPGIGRKLTQLRYGLTGTIPDGLLVRVSSIGSDEQFAYTLQQRFVVDLLASLKSSDRVKLTGS